MPRMRILNSVEKETFDSPPQFDAIQRKQYFDLPVAIQRMAMSLRTPVNQVGFILSCGYFKAAKRFFVSDSFHQRDIDYVASKINLDAKTITIGDYDKQSIARHHQLILKYYGYRVFDQKARQFILSDIKAMVNTQLKPRLIFWRCVDLLIREKVQVPNYFKLSELILKVINSRKKELGLLINKHLDTETRSLIDALFEQDSDENIETQLSSTKKYRLTLLKKLSQSTKPTKVKEKVSDLVLLKELYQQLLPMLDRLGLNHDGIQYYANSVIKSEIFQIARRSDEDRYLHTIAFIAHQYYRLQDNLIDVLLTSMQTFNNSAEREHKEFCYLQRDKQNNTIKSLLGALDDQFLNAFTDIELITSNPSIDDQVKIIQIRDLLQDNAQQRSSVKQELSELRKQFKPGITKEDYFNILELKSIRLQNRISPIIKSLTFLGEPFIQPLIDAIDYFKEKDGLLDMHAPCEFLDAQELNAVNNSSKKFRISLYKVFLFRHIQKGVKSGALNLKHSYKYRALDDYLIDRQRWLDNKPALLERAGMQDFENSDQVLNTLNEHLTRQYLLANKHILDDENQLVRFDKNNRITITTPKRDASTAEPLQDLLPERQYIPLLEVLSTVERHSSYLSEFQHWQQRYRRKPPLPKTFYAGVIGLGCGIGTRKISRISQQIKESSLEHTINWYFSIENLRAANDKVLRLADSLELPDIYRRNPDKLHTVSDGQKFTVTGESLNANYSFKYHGKEQGVSVGSFIDERSLLFHSIVFSSAERESAYIIDGLMHNDVIKSNIHSSDTHGYSEAIFGTSHLLGFSYAPRIKGLKRQQLYIFRGDEKLGPNDWKIKPVKYINTKLIQEQWDDILRLIATIKLKEVTASELFRRLNSYSKQHDLYRALKAFGQIIKSIFILRYIDDVELRQAIELQLSRIEQSHRFARAVSVGSPREFIQAEKEEQEIAEACRRLIKNCIICWNYLYLSQRLLKANSDLERDTMLESIKNGSIISWRHINLLGEYDFSDEKMQDSVGIKPPKLASSVA